MTGSPVDIFNQQYKIGHVSGILGACPIGAVTSYDVANAQLSLTYQYDSYISDPLCSAAANPMLLGYNEKYDLDSFNMKMDVNSLITALAVRFINA